MMKMTKALLCACCLSMLGPVSAFGQLLPLGEEFTVNSFTPGTQARPWLATGPGGEFVVIWQGGTFVADGQDGSEGGILGQRYAAGGSPVGGEFQVNTYTTDNQRDPAVAIGPSSEFVVTWDSMNNGTYDIQAQRYAADGSPQGAEFQINTFTYDNQYRSAVGSGPDGHMIVVWESFDSPAPDFGPAILGQRFVNTDPIFPDGFESGDTSAWSSTVP